MGELWSALGGYGVEIVPIFIVPGPPAANQRQVALSWTSTWMPPGAVLSGK